MKLATFSVPPSGRGARLGSWVPPGTFWAQFGDEVLLYSDEPRWRDSWSARERAPCNCANIG